MHCFVVNAATFCFFSQQKQEETAARRRWCESENIFVCAACRRGYSLCIRAISTVREALRYTKKQCAACLYSANFICKAKVQAAYIPRIAYLLRLTAPSGSYYGRSTMGYCRKHRLPAENLCVCGGGARRQCMHNRYGAPYGSTPRTAVSGCVFFTSDCFYDTIR